MIPRFRHFRDHVLPHLRLAIRDLNERQLSNPSRGGLGRPRRRARRACSLWWQSRRGLARFVLLGEPLHGTLVPLGFGRLCRLTLGEQLLGSLASELIGGVAFHLRIEHFQGPAAGVDLVVMGEIGELFEDAEQLLVPGRAESSRCRRGTAR